MVNEVFLLLGSNLGDSLAILQNAREKIAVLIGPIKRQSGIYKTAPWGVINQPDFFNQVIVVETALDPQSLLNQTSAIEHQLGRVRKEKWGARAIDVDILFFNEKIINETNLRIPHPGIPDRKFTLVPLAEIASAFSHPTLNKTISELLAECDDPSAVEKVMV